MELSFEFGIEGAKWPSLRAKRERERERARKRSWPSSFHLSSYCAPPLLDQRGGRRLAARPTSSGVQWAPSCAVGALVRDNTGIRPPLDSCGPSKLGELRARVQWRNNGAPSPPPIRLAAPLCCTLGTASNWNDALA